MQKIVIGEYINLGKKYWSKVGNKVHITERKEAAEGVGYEYKGKVIQVVEGHEIWQNKSMWFDEKGQWLKNKKGIHNLARECLD